MQPTTIKDLMIMLSNRYFAKTNQVMAQQRLPLQQFQNSQIQFNKSKLFQLSKKHQNKSNPQKQKSLASSNQKNNEQKAMIEQLYKQMSNYKSKCQTLQNQNTQLKQKIDTYQKNFKQEKELVQNLKNMISSRERQVDLVFQKEKTFFKKEKQHAEIITENDVLKKELLDVRELLKQQEAIIIQLYSNNKNQQRKKEKYQSTF